MPIELADAQDAYKDAGEQILFTTLMLKREDRAAELEAIQNFADRFPSIINSMNIRAQKADLRVAFGFSSDAWDYLFPTANKPAELETFTDLTGPDHTMPGTPGDLFFHVRAHDEAVVYEVMSQFMTFLRAVTTVVDETKGFRYFEGRAIIGFIDGTENPDGSQSAEYGLIGDEDREFINGSYAFAQQYVHDMETWNAFKVEMQEKYIGRQKMNDLELEDEEKDPRAHNVVAKLEVDGEEQKIVRMNVPFADAAAGTAGTYFIAYMRHYWIVKQMLTRMVEQNDRLLDFSEVTTGTAFFIPSKSVLARIADGDL
ncbi:Dyp-type peroxidase [Periweissella cryptocerci]|uniref:Dyp-type peroxidase n=1 Tax=Periweissella cryptocerci TaxID=2506420 RepID=A0A4P6YVS4_9LACO|nr:Dyp-type peroxidase [Periweissella cryptocerci]QBO36827.1 Dyp-type peroxidase [Periweissella cryptocerci]